MSRLHTIQASVEDILRHFGAEAPVGLTVPSETVEGTSGLIVIERDGKRHLRSFRWGFPRQSPESQLRGDPPKPVGLVADLTNPMWDKVAPDPRYRCLIVLTHFANPEGKPGTKTRTWFSVVGHPIMAWAGFCRNTPAFGPVYAGMTREASAAIPPPNDRMPVLLLPHEYDLWLRGSIRDVIRFQFGPTVAAERMVIERTEDRWRGGASVIRTDLQTA